MRVLAVLALFLLPLLSSAQTPPPAPSLVIAADVISGQSSQIYLSWTVPSMCPQATYGCHFTLWHDDGTKGDGVGAFVANQQSYGWTISDLSSYTAGNHTFWVSADSIYPVYSVPSNNLTIGINPTPNASPIITANGGVVGDPQFTGLRGQTYQVHGMPNEIFSIVSDVDFQYNSRFVYLAEGRCPTLDGRKLDTPCFTHPGTYLGELALMTSAGDRLYLQAGGADEGFLAVELNGEALEEAEEVTELQALAGRPQPFVVRNSSHVVTVQMGNFWLEFVNSDAFINQRVAMLDPSLQTSHGLLGQTWSGKIYDADATIPWIEGKVWDYAMADHELFSHSFAFNVFVTPEDADDEDDKAASGKLGKLLDGVRRGQRKGGRQHGKRTGRTHSHEHADGADL